MRTINLQKKDKTLKFLRKDGKVTFKSCRFVKKQTRKKNKVDFPSRTSFVQKSTKTVTMIALRQLIIATYFVSSIIAEDDNSLLSVFFGNTGLGRWWMGMCTNNLDHYITSEHATDASDAT